MTTVWMKWLEKKPRFYEQGLRIATLGRSAKMDDWIMDLAVRPGSRVLEIGCGTGRLTLEMARGGARITALDLSERMLREARQRAARAGISDRVEFHHADARQIGKLFQDRQFDVLIAKLVLSEIPPEDHLPLLRELRALSTPRGFIILADEFRPARTLPLLLFLLLRFIFVPLTWLVTRSSTRPLRDAGALFKQAGLQIEDDQSYLGGMLKILAARPVLPVGTRPPAAAVERLRHRVTLKTVLLDARGLFFRLFPPYPKVKPALYRVGSPDPTSPVLVTGNFDLTVRRLLRWIDGRVDAWLLVVDSAGLNVWCGSGAGFLTAGDILQALEKTALSDQVTSRRLILPQLCAVGVRGLEIEENSPWQVTWGPIRARDLPAFLESGTASEEMRRIDFPLLHRLEMAAVSLGFYSLLILIPAAIFWRAIFVPLAAALVGLVVFYAAVHPWLPGKDGLWKSIPLTALTWAGFFAYTNCGESLPLPLSFRWLIGLTGLSVFTAAEMQGMSPLMRGEQANWKGEALIALLLIALWICVPYLAGWR